MSTRCQMIVLLVTALSVACAKGLGGPSPRDISDDYSSLLPDHWSLLSFDIEVSENLGTQVEPRIAHRFKAVLELKEDTYRMVRWEAGVTLVEQAVQAGQEEEMYGIATAELWAGSWKLSYSIEEDPTTEMGKPRAAFDSETVLKDSEEEVAFRAELDRKRREAEAEAERWRREMGLPEGVTVEMVDEGREIFSGAGYCYACHGHDGKGIPGLGADLTDGDWVHIDGSYESIVTLITDGVSAEASTNGTPMSPGGGGGITDDQVRAVGVYVYTLSHGK